MPVSFFVDPEIAEDPGVRDVGTITLSYTFFRAQEPSAQAVARERTLAAINREQPHGG